MFMPDFIRNLDEWIIWLLAEEFHEEASPEMIVQRTGYDEEQVLRSIGNLERMKAVRVTRNVRQATKIEKIGLVPEGRRIHADLSQRGGSLL
jgi:hypothetical protein